MCVGLVLLEIGALMHRIIVHVDYVEASKVCVSGGWDMSDGCI